MLPARVNPALASVSIVTEVPVRWHVSNAKPASWMPVRFQYHAAREGRKTIFKK